MSTLQFLLHSSLLRIYLVTYTFIPTLCIAYTHIYPAFFLSIVSPLLPNADEDFEVLNDGIATFTPDSQVATVQIRALTDEIQEPDEVFTIEARLTDSSTSLGVVIGGNGKADVVVKDMTAGNRRTVTNSNLIVY